MHHPFVRDGDCANAGAAVTRMKKGPENIPELEAAGATYTDTDFVMPDSLFWDGYETTSFESGYDTGIADGTYTWQRWKDVAAYSSNTLFTNGTVNYNEVNQGGAGTCYFMMAIASGAEWPDMITDMFL